MENKIDNIIKKIGKRPLWCFSYGGKEWVFDIDKVRDLEKERNILLKALLMQADLITNMHKRSFTSQDISEVNHAIFDAIKEVTGMSWEELNKE